MRKMFERSGGPDGYDGMLDDEMIEFVQCACSDGFVQGGW